MQTRVEIRRIAGPLPTPCEEYQGYVDRQGYPVRGRPYKAAVRLHRELWDQEHGADSRKGFVVHHRCENKRCLNIEHMELVTRGDHARLHHPSKVDSGLARRLYAVDGWTQRQIADFFGCSHTIIGRRCRGLKRGGRSTVPAGHYLDKPIPSFESGTGIECP